MSGSIKLTTPGSGSVNLTPASSIASDVTVNVPSQNCTLGIQGPAFSAYLSANQSISNSTSTKVALNSELFDTANCFDSTTNYRFTPNVAGYYQVNAMIAANGTGITAIVTDIRKNGSTYRNNVLQGAFSPTTGVNLSDVIYMNGSTDYLELYGQVNASASTNFGGNSTYTFMSASLVRSA